MTVPRALLVLLLMITVGVAVVCVRGESAKTANRIQRLHQQKVVLRQKLWATELELAKLRGPEAIRERAAEMKLEVIPPETPPPAGAQKNKKPPAVPLAD